MKETKLITQFRPGDMFEHCGQVVAVTSYPIPLTNESFAVEIRLENGTQSSTSAKRSKLFVNLGQCKDKEQFVGGVYIERFCPEGRKIVQLQKSIRIISRTGLALELFYHQMRCERCRDQIQVRSPDLVRREGGGWL